MCHIQLFVEDELNEAYEILAGKIVAGNRPGCRIRAARLTLDEFTAFESLLDLTQRARRSGCRQVIFIIDQEGPGADPGRREALARFRDAFQELCDHIDGLPDGDPLKHIHVVRVEAHSCLEAWLLSDPRAIVAAAGGASYVPPRRETHHLTPREAREQIAHIVREVGRRRSRRHLQRIGGHAVKSWGGKIALHLDLSQARKFNFSLDYFCGMIEDDRDGCLHPFPRVE